MQKERSDGDYLCMQVSNKVSNVLEEKRTVQHNSASAGQSMPSYELQAIKLRAFQKLLLWDAMCAQGSGVRNVDQQ